MELVALISAALLALCQAVWASETITVSDPAALQTAVAQGGTLKLAFDATITLSNAFLIATNTTLDATGHAVSLDGGNLVRHFTVTNGAALRLVNLALVNGRFVGADGQTDGPGDPGFGGSIYGAGGRLELESCRFMSNQVSGGAGGPAGFSFSPTSGGPGYGGAIYWTNGVILSTNCTFANSSCVGGHGTPAHGSNTGRGGDSFGGAIYAAGSQLSLVGVRLMNNFCKGGEAGAGARWGLGDGAAYGGAVAETNGSSMLGNCLFSGNQALGGRRLPFEAVNGNGGAIFHASGAMLIDGSLFSGNQAVGGAGYVGDGIDPTIAGDGYGGGIFNQGGQLTLRNSTLVSNQANGPNALCCARSSPGGNGWGGAIYSTAPLDVSNCTLVQNSANGGAAVEAAGSAPGGSAYGGAIAVAAGSMSLLNVTIASNSVQTGQGYLGLSGEALGSSIWIQGAAGTLTNTLLASTSSQTNVSGTLNDGGHNICSDGSAGFTSVSSRMNLDPVLGALADNGGPTPTMALLPTSPAIDAGDNSVCPATDQRGVTRPQGLACDIGAFELAPKLALARDAGGIVTLTYSFKAESTNSVTASTNLLSWLLLGTGLSDTNGVLQRRDPDAANLPRRFYVVRPLPSP